MYWRGSHQLSFVVAYGSFVAWQLYVGTSGSESVVCVRASTTASVQPAPPAVPEERFSGRKPPEAACSGEFLLTGLSHASFQKIRQPAWHPPCAEPSQRVSRWTASATRRPRTGKTVSQVLCARLYT